MADNFSGSITLGGSIQLRLLEELVRRLAAAGVGVDYGPPISPEAISVAINAAHAGRQTIQFTHPRALYGQFPGLEEWLTSKKLSWDRHSDPASGYSEEHVYGRGGHEPIRRVADSDGDGDDMVAAEDMRAILRSVKPAHWKLTKINELVKPVTKLRPLTLVGK